MGRAERVELLRPAHAAHPHTGRKVLILNVRSGSAAGASRGLARAARAARTEVIEVGRGVDLQLAVRSRMRDGVRHFIVGGGDGTLRNVVQPLVGSEATVGVIPLGTYNRFARDLGIPLKWPEALEVALNGSVQAVDVGLVNGTPFLSAVTLGIHPAMLEARERLRGRHSNALALACAVASAFKSFQLAQLALETGGSFEHIRTPVFTVSVNAVAFDGGLPVRPKMDAGLLSAWWLTESGRIATAAQISTLLLGRSMEAGLRERTGTRMTIHPTARANIGIDGEVTTARTPLSLAIRPRALKVRT